MFGVTATDYYAVLGIDSTASIDDIKKAFRQAARENHPDVADATSHEERQANATRFDVAKRAYDWLMIHHQPIVKDSEAEGETIIGSLRISVDGVPAELVTVKDSWGFSRTDMIITLDDARKLRGYPVGEHLHSIVVIDDGDKLFKAYGFSFESLQRELRDYDRQREVVTFNEKLVVLKETKNQLALKGRPVGKLQDMIWGLDDQISRYAYAWSRISESKLAINRLFGQVEQEVRRLSANGTQLLIDGLVDGSIHHRDLTFNQKVAEQLASLSIRSDGFIEPLTEEQLRSHYTERIGQTEDIYDLQGIDLKLLIEDYAPKEIIDELEMAPEMVEIEGRKGTIAYDVDYTTALIDSQSTSVGVIAIPLSVFERHASDYGKPSNFPMLPYGIKLLFKVTVDGKQVAAGFDDDALAKKLAKYKRSKSRGQALAGVGDDYGSGRFSPILPGPLPPWHQGQRIRW